MSSEEIERVHRIFDFTDNMNSFFRTIRIGIVIKTIEFSSLRFNTWRHVWHGIGFKSNEKERMTRKEKKNLKLPKASRKHNCRRDKGIYQILYTSFHNAVCGAFQSNYLLLSCLDSIEYYHLRFSSTTRIRNLQIQWQ